MGRCLFYCQSRSQPRRSGGAPASGRWARGWVRTNVSPSAAGTLGFFCIFFNTKSCILMHSLAPKMDTTSVFIKTGCIGGNEDCWKRLPNEARRAENRGRRPRAGWSFGEGQQAPPARGSGSDVNKTKFLRPRPK